MATEARHRLSKTPAAPTNPLHSDPTFTPGEYAEFIDSLKEDEAPAEATACNGYDPEYND